MDVSKTLRTEQASTQGFIEDFISGSKRKNPEVAYEYSRDSLTYLATLLGYLFI